MNSNWKRRYGFLVVLTLVLSKVAGAVEPAEQDGERLLGFHGFEYPALSPDGERGTRVGNRG